MYFFPTFVLHTTLWGVRTQTTDSRRLGVLTHHWLMHIIDIQYTSTPCGRMILGSYDGRLCLCDWVASRWRTRTDARLQHALQATYAVRCSTVITQAMGQLEEYFQGRRRAFDLPLLPVGTEFQRLTWRCLCTIPYGATLSYAQEARLMGRPSAVRAVAQANGANALSIVIPCHRVIGSSGRLTGYAGGMQAKEFLLALEQRVCAQDTGLARP